MSGSMNERAGSSVADEPDGLLIGRITISKYATDNDVIILVEQDDGSGDIPALVDALGMVAFAQAHFANAMCYEDEDDE